VNSYDLAAPAGPVTRVLLRVPVLPFESSRISEAISRSDGFVRVFTFASLNGNFTFATYFTLLFVFSCGIARPF
jgi:hypothetical protein